MNKSFLKTLNIFFAFFLHHIASGQAVKPFYAPPMLEFLLSEEWNNQNLDYNEAMWTPAKKKYVNKKKGISIHYQTNIIQYLDAPPDSMIVQVEKSFKYEGKKYTKKIIHGFKLYFPKDKTAVENRSGYHVVAFHPEGYYAELKINFDKLNYKKSYPIVKKILKNINIVSPKYIDKKIGLPIPLSVDRDSLFKANIDTIRIHYKKKYSEYYTLEQLERKINALTPMDVIPEAFNNFSLEKKYSVLKDIMTGTLDLEETLDWKYLSKNSPKINFFKQYVGGYHGEGTKGINLSIIRNLSKFINTENLMPPYGGSHKTCANKDTIFWETMEQITRDSFILMSAKKIDNKWNLTFNTFHYKDPNTVAHIDYKSSCRRNKNNQNFLIIKTKDELFAPEYWIGLSSSQNSSFFHIQDTFSTSRNYFASYFIKGLVPLQRRLDYVEEVTESERQFLSTYYSMMYGNVKYDITRLLPFISSELEKIEYNDFDSIMVQQQVIRSQYDKINRKIRASTIDEDEVTDAELLFSSKVAFDSMSLSPKDFISFELKHSDALKQRYSYDSIASNFKDKILYDTTWISYADESRPSHMEVVEKDKSFIVENFIDEQFVDNSPPEKRVYISLFQYSDFDNDGNKEIYRYAISNGKLVELKIFEETKDNILPLNPDKKFLNWIMGTVDFQYILKISLSNENLLSR